MGADGERPPVRRSSVGEVIDVAEKKKNWICCICLFCCTICGGGMGTALFVAWSIYSEATVCSLEKFNAPCYWYVAVTGKMSHEQFSVEDNRDYFCQHNIYVRADRTRIGISHPVKVFNQHINDRLVKYKFVGYKAGNIWRNDPDPAWETRVAAGGGQEGYLTYIGLRGRAKDNSWRWYDQEELGDFHMFGPDEPHLASDVFAENDEVCVAIHANCPYAPDDVNCIGGWTIEKCSCSETMEQNSENPITGSREIDMCTPGYHTKPDHTEPVVDGFWCQIAPGEYPPFN